MRAEGMEETLLRDEPIINEHKLDVRREVGPAVYGTHDA